MMTEAVTAAAERDSSRPKSFVSRILVSKFFDIWILRRVSRRQLADSKDSGGGEEGKGGTSAKLKADG